MTPDERRAIQAEVFGEVGEELLATTTAIMEKLDPEWPRSRGDEIGFGFADDGRVILHVGATTAYLFDRDRADRVVEATPTRVRLIGPEEIAKERAVAPDEPDLN